VPSVGRAIHAENEVLRGVADLAGLPETAGGAFVSGGTAAKGIDVPVVVVEPDRRGRLSGERLTAALTNADVDGYAAIATAGATNTGLDDLATGCHQHGMWLHVDAAYGGAAMVAPSARPLFHIIERADSFVVDPHDRHGGAAQVVRSPTPPR
jgi:glutamate/tyrosine decarboxylase-like PLP-dependent enzyme